MNTVYDRDSRTNDGEDAENINLRTINACVKNAQRCTVDIMQARWRYLLVYYYSSVLSRFYNAILSPRNRSRGADVDDLKNMLILLLNNN